MNNYRSSFLLWLLLFVVTAAAQGPNNSGTYYKNANGYKGRALKSRLYAIINPHTTLSYDALWDAYKTTDRRADGKLWDMYSDITNFVIGGSAQGASYKNEGDSYNREHSLPKSWFRGRSPMYTDLFHLIPADGYVNNRRSNYPFGENKGEGYKSANGFSKLGSCTTEGGSGTVFEPNDEYKGDFARIYFYMATAYEATITSWSSAGSGSAEIFSKDEYKPFVDWQMNMLLRWAKEDPVSQKEIDRNNAVYALQGNRNPFVDYPGLEDYVWGDSVNVAFSYDHYRKGVPSGPTVEDKVIFSEPFAANAGSFNIDNKTQAEGLTKVWTPYKNSTVSCMKGSAYYDKTNYAAESWLISPEIDLTTAEGKVTLTLDQLATYLKNNDVNDFLSVMISKDAGQTWERLDMNIPVVASGWVFKSTSADLSPWKGSKVKLAFRYISTAACAPTWEVKNLVVKSITSTGISRPVVPQVDNGIVYTTSGMKAKKGYRGVVIQQGHKKIFK